MKCTRYLRLFLSLVFFSFVAPNWSAAAPWTPVEWQDAGKLRHWVRDANGNFVDDLIEERGKQSDVIVDLNSCAGDPGSSKIVAYLNTLGDVTYVGKYLTFIVVAGIDPNDALLIAARPEVAMVELAEDGKWNWDIFQAAKVKSSAPYSNTLQSDFGWPTTLNGAGINIAIVDSGVNSTYDPAFQYGYDGLTDTEGNPAHCPATEACGDHGSYMAEVVFDSRDGIARGAGLIDVKVGGSAGPDGAAYVRALEKIYEKRDDWNIHVVSISAGFSGAADGNESYNKLLDLLSGGGVVVVASAGDNAADAPVTTPGAATRAIAVAAADMTNTVSRADDTAPFVRGPRPSDGDSDALDELKPEVVFPTGGSYWYTSNSASTAATAGLAALVLGHNPELADRANRAAGSVKDLLIRSAEVKGTADTPVRYPHSAASWDDRWGFGEVDAHAAFANLSDTTQGGLADLTFIGFDGSPHPSTPWYYSHAIETQSGRNRDNITSGVPDRIFAKIRNNDSATANRVRVSFGFYPFTAGIPTFYDIGSVVVDLPGSMDREVSIDWIPPVMTAGDEHGCLVVTIDYGYDKEFANRSNSAQKNVRVERTSSPAEFDFRVENTLPTKANIHLEVENQIDGWEMKLSEYDFVADPAECARTIRAVVTPTRQHTEGMEALFFVSAYAAELGTEKYKPIGGVALKTLYGKDTTVRPPTNIVVVAGGLALLLFAYFWYTRSRRD